MGTINYGTYAGAFDLMYQVKPEEVAMAVEFLRKLKDARKGRRPGFRFVGGKPQMHALMAILPPDTHGEQKRAMEPLGARMLGTNRDVKQNKWWNPDARHHSHAKATGVTGSSREHDPKWFYLYHANGQRTVVTEDGLRFANSCANHMVTRRSGCEMGCVQGWRQVDDRCNVIPDGKWLFECAFGWKTSFGKG